MRIKTAHIWEYEDLRNFMVCASPRGKNVMEINNLLLHILKQSIKKNGYKLEFRHVTHNRCFQNLAVT